MSIYIHGIDMPTKQLLAVINPDGLVEILNSDNILIEEFQATQVPPHGRLIDADALEELVIKQKYACAGASAHGSISELHKSWGLHDAELMVEAAPTIIPAEEG